MMVGRPSILFGARPIFRVYFKHQGCMTKEFTTPKQPWCPCRYIQHLSSFDIKPSLLIGGTENRYLFPQMKIISSNCQSGRGGWILYLLTCFTCIILLKWWAEFSHYDVIWVRWKIHGPERMKHSRTHYFYTYVCFTLKPPSFNHKYPSTPEDIPWVTCKSCKVDLKLFVWRED